MYVDAITLAAVVDEWQQLLLGARIDTIIQPTEYSIAVQCYVPAHQGQAGQNHWLYLSAHPQMARAHLTTRKPAKISNEPPAFVMLLRKYLEGSRIEFISQPRWERVLEITTGYRGTDSEAPTRLRLVIEIMGRTSNIILCDEQGTILGSLKHVGPAINRYRVIAANVQYVPPPPQTRTFAGQVLPRLDPAAVTAAQLAILATDIETEPAAFPPQATPAKKGRSRPQEQQKLWQLLTRNLLGFSPLLARETVYRTTGDLESSLDVSENTWEELARNTRELASLYDTHGWEPQLVEHADNEADSAASTFPIAFAPYALQQYASMPGARIRTSSSINILIDEYYAGAEWRDAMEGVRSPIRKVLQTQRERVMRKAQLLREELAAAEEANSYRLQGELLLAYQHEITQGQTSVTVRNYFDDQAAEVTIPLDPRFDAVGNANRLFNKYHKLRRGLALVPGQIEQNATELATIEQLLTDLALAEMPAEVVLVKAEVQASGYMRGAKMGKPAAGSRGKQAAKGKPGKQEKGNPVPPGGGVPLHVQSRDGFTILIGKNSRQNEEVTFRQASANDIWLHDRGVPGSHVVIKAAGREVPRSTIEQAASLAAWYSQARGSTSVAVDYTLQRHVRHMKGGGPGMVIYERERTLYAEPSSFSR